MKSFMFAAVAALALTSTVSAATISGVSAGLVDPDAIIDFADPSFAAGTDITDQYEDQGATFENFSFRPTDSPRPNSERPWIANFIFNTDNPTASIFFNEASSDATFALLSNNGSATFTSLLKGLVVETFTASIAFPEQTGPDGDNIFGFTGSVFDEIRIVSSGSTGYSLDNLAFNAADVAPVPLPAGLPMLLAGLGAFGLVRRKRATS